MAWEVWSKHGRHGVQGARFESEWEGRVAFCETWFSSVLLDPDSMVVARKSGLLEVRCCRAGSSSVDEILAERKVIREDSPCWLLAAHVGGAVCWRSFTSEDAALRQYGRTWWSKALFRPGGRLLKCSTAELDLMGVGVASILRLQFCACTPAAGTFSRTSTVKAIESGDAPFVPRDRPAAVQKAMKLAVLTVLNRASMAAYFGLGPGHSLCFFDAGSCPRVRGHVALTLDDAPCRFGRENSMVPQVRALLRERGARATFMIIGKFADGHEADLVDLLRDGHELGNHGMLDRPYHADRAEDFARSLAGCSARIRALQREAGAPEGVRWFRAPHAKYTEAMAGVVAAHGLTNVFCDTYACCPIIQDGEFIGDSLAENACDGSILLLHMPEAGYRDWCLTALRRLLEGLQRRGLSVVTVGELDRLAREPAREPASGA